jgi:N-acetylglucosamine-6-phosphate deacetylase
MIRTAFSIYGEDRVILISDSMEATGMPDGTYSLGGQSVTVKGNLATLQDGTIAGSATNLMDCVRFAVKKVGLPLETAIKCATANPAKSIGVFDKYGSLDVGKAADFVLLDKDLNLKGVYVNGKKIV